MHLTNLLNKHNASEKEKESAIIYFKDKLVSSSSVETFINNILIWYEEYLNNGLDAIISNTSGCGTTLKDYGFLFRSDKELKKKAKKISELTKDITEYLNEKVKLNFIKP